MKSLIFLVFFLLGAAFSYNSATVRCLTNVHNLRRTSRLNSFTPGPGDRDKRITRASEGDVFESEVSMKVFYAL